jgi:hypothetical protein
VSSTRWRATCIKPRADFYKTSHPGPRDVLLIIEVADTTLRYDRDVKTLLYARSDRPDLSAAITIDSLPNARIELSALFAD